MLVVHCRLNPPLPSEFFPGFPVSSLLPSSTPGCELGTERVKCLATELNIMIQQGIKWEPLNFESSMLTIRLLYL